MIKAILFDMDGLIFDTESIYYKSWQYAANQQGFIIEDSLYSTFVGMKDKECEDKLVARYQFDLPTYKFDRDKHHEELSQTTPDFMPGFQSLFAQAKTLGLKIGLVTSSNRDTVEFNFSNSPYLEQFDIIVTGEDVANGKPDPDCFTLGASKIKELPKYCLVLEDSNNGVMAGVKAGCQTVMIPDLTSPNEYSKANASQILSSLDYVQLDQQTLQPTMDML